MRSLPFLFVDDFEGNADISVATKSCSTVSDILHIPGRQFLVPHPSTRIKVIDADVVSKGEQRAQSLERQCDVILPLAGRQPLKCRQARVSLSDIITILREFTKTVTLVAGSLVVR